MSPIRNSGSLLVSFFGKALAGRRGIDLYLGHYRQRGVSSGPARRKSKKGLRK